MSVKSIRIQEHKKMSQHTKKWANVKWRHFKETYFAQKIRRMTVDTA